jgi:hypothetical protein
VAQGRQQDLVWAEELEGKYLWLSVVEHFFEMCFLSPVMIRTEEQACHGGGRAFVGVGGPKDGAARALRASCHRRAIYAMLLERSRCALERACYGVVLVSPSSGFGPR